MCEKVPTSMLYGHRDGWLLLDHPGEEVVVSAKSGPYALAGHHYLPVVSTITEELALGNKFLTFLSVCEDFYFICQLYADIDGKWFAQSP